ncbi:MAG TPA: hypothetical protein VM578_00855 [Candidatus Saccharimonadales bacterium]|nr:hypothetical protein [Candidatus Saccharimonadales bacterium]
MERSKRARVFVALMLMSVAICVRGQANPSRSFGPDACGPADPSYIHTASATGGIPLFLQRSEASKAFQLVRESTKNNVSLVFWAMAPLDGKPLKFAIPVDSGTRTLTVAFSVNVKGTMLTLRRPSGEALAGSVAGTEDTELNCGRIVTVTSPQPGMWHAEVTGTGTFWMNAQAQSDIYFISAEFVRPGGRPGHEGLFRIQGQPLAGVPATLQASLSAAETKTAHFSLVSERGDILQTLHMKQVNSDREFLEFVGTLDLPKVPFRVAVEGIDSHGRQYQRFYAGLFHASSVEVSPKLDFDGLPSGSTRQAAFLVRNNGAPETFRVTVTDTRRFVSRVEPKEISLATGESAMIRMELTVPAATASGTGDDLVVVVASTTHPGTSNSSVVHLSVSSSAGQSAH